MIDGVNILLILGAALVAGMSPGPATLAIAGTSMKAGRKLGLALALGISTGSLIWSVSAAVGLGAVMLANSWMLETVRYFGAGYLLFLAYKSARSAFSASSVSSQSVVAPSLRAAYSKGLALHLTNPKAILFFGALFSIGVPPGTPPETIAVVVAAVGIQSLLMFCGYAVVFSSPKVASGYARLRRWFEGVFAVAFGAAGLKILTEDLGSSS